jgi:plasmid stabilization system protein ParE
VKYILVAQDRFGWIRWLEPHENPLHAFSRLRRLRHQFRLRSAELRIYTERGEVVG